MDRTAFERCSADERSSVNTDRVFRVVLRPLRCGIVPGCRVVAWPWAQGARNSGTRIKRITPEADAEWEARMAELAKSETARLEAERRRELALSGQIAAESPRHVSRRGARSTPTPRRRRP
jgi:hypothetical protein